MTSKSVPALPDLLRGVAAIADHLGWSRRQVYHAHEKGQLPTFKLGAIVCARRSGLAEHFAAQEAAARATPAKAAPGPGGRTVRMLAGITAIAEHLGMRMTHARRLHEARAIPTMVRNGRVEATTAGLDDYLAITGEA